MPDHDSTLTDDNGTIDWRKSMTRRQLLIGGVAVGAGFYLAGCGSKSAGPGATASPNALTSPTTKPGSLTVHAWGPPWSTSLQKTSGQTFTAQTGIPIKYDTSDFDAMHTKIAQALQAGRRPPVDVNWTIDRYAARAVGANMCAPLDPAIVTNYALLTPGGRQDPQIGDILYYANLYTYSMPISYRKDKITPTPGMSWLDLEPQRQSMWRGKMVGDPEPDLMLPPIAKALGIDLATGDLGPVWAEFKKMKPDFVGYGSDTYYITALKSGQADGGVQLIGDNYVLMDAGIPMAWIVPKEGATMLSDSMYIPRGLPHDVTYYAQVYLNHVLDAANQTQFCSDVRTVPTNRNAKPRQDMMGDPAFPFTEEEIAKYAIPLPTMLAAKMDPQWQATYNATMGVSSGGSSG